MFSKSDLMRYRSVNPEEVVVQDKGGRSDISPGVYWCGILFLTGVKFCMEAQGFWILWVLQNEGFGNLCVFSFPYLSDFPWGSLCQQLNCPAGLRDVGPSSSRWSNPLFLIEHLVIFCNTVALFLYFPLTTFVLLPDFLALGASLVFKAFFIMSNPVDIRAEWYYVIHLVPLQLVVWLSQVHTTQTILFVSLLRFIVSVNGGIKVYRCGGTELYTQIHNFIETYPGRQWETISCFRCSLSR